MEPMVYFWKSVLNRIVGTIMLPMLVYVKSQNRWEFKWKNL